jgi:hypothetical protein
MSAVVEIIGEMKASFLLTLTLENFADLDGEWSGLPGFLPATKGRFGVSNGAGLSIYEKEPVFDYKRRTHDAKIYG